MINAIALLLSSEEAHPSKGVLFRWTLDRRLTMEETGWIPVAGQAPDCHVTASSWDATGGKFKNDTSPSACRCVAVASWSPTTTRATQPGELDGAARGDARTRRRASPARRRGSMGGGTILLVNDKKSMEQRTYCFQQIGKKARSKSNCFCV
jgi:hypothetical protein